MRVVSCFGAATLTVILCLLPALAAARHSAPSTAAAPSTPSLRLGMPDVSLTVDPALVADEQNAQFASLLYSGLVRLNASYRVVKDAAASYTISRDRRTYTFYLRHGLRFSNGDPMTSDDFRYSIQRSLSPSLRSPSAPTYLLDIAGAYAYLTGKAKSVSGLRTLGKYTLRITARWPVPYFLTELTYPTSFALDSKRLKKLGAVDSTGWYSSPISSGPYKLKSWATESTVQLEPNKYYAGPRPSIPRVTLSLGSLPTSGLYQYIARSTDVVSLPTYDGSLLRQPGMNEAKMLAIDGVYMNVHRKPFASVAVRRALTLALKRTSLVTATMKKSVTPFGGYVPIGEAGYDPRLKVLGYDAVSARKQLASAGYAQGKRFPSTTLYYAADDPSQAKLASAIARAWHSVLHITVGVQGLTVNTLFAKVQSNTLPLYLFGWSADYPDPHDWLGLQWETGALDNNVRYHNANFDRVVQTADVKWKPAARARLYDQAQQMLVNDAAWIPLYIPHRVVYVRSTVQNLLVTGYGVIPRSGNWAGVQLRKPPSKFHGTD